MLTDPQIVGSIAGLMGAIVLLVGAVVYLAKKGGSSTAPDVVGLTSEAKTVLLLSQSADSMARLADTVHSVAHQLAIHMTSEDGRHEAMDKILGALGDKEDKRHEGIERAIEKLHAKLHEKPSDRRPS